MGVIVGTLAKKTELCGEYKLYTITATIESADDDITLTQADHNISEIAGIVSCVVTGGLDNAFTYVGASFSGLVITVISLVAAGTGSTGWGDTTVSITLLGKSE